MKPLSGNWERGLRRERRETGKRLNPGFLMVHLDTSFLIRALVRGSPEDQKLREMLGTSEPLGMSTIAWAEFLCGPIDQSELKLATEVIRRHSTFSQQQAMIAARLFNESGRPRGTFIDCMIAAAALSAGALIATSNVSDFRRFEPFGLKIVSY